MKPQANGRDLAMESIMQLTALVGALAGIITAVSMAPQLFKILKEKKAEDVSLSTLLILMSGLLLWVIYGVLKRDWPIAFTNGFSFLLNVVLTFFRTKYAKGE